MQLASLTRPGLIFADLPSVDAATVLRDIAQRLEQEGVVRDGDALYRSLQEREELGSTGIGSEVAIPHCKAKGLDEVVVSVAICPKGVEFGAVDDKPVKVFFTVVSPARSPAAHLQSLAAISKWVKAERHIERILALREPEEIFQLLSEEAVGD